MKSGPGSPQDWLYRHLGQRISVVVAMDQGMVGSLPYFNLDAPGNIGSNLEPVFQFLPDGRDS